MNLVAAVADLTFGATRSGIKNFRDQCRQRKVQATAHLASRPDDDQIILSCEHELREFLRRGRATRLGVDEWKTR